MPSNRRIVNPSILHTLMNGWICFLLIVLASPSMAAPRSAPTTNAAVTWRLLDYIAVDYASAVQNGQVVNAAEYAEMSEFSATVIAQLQALPDHPQQADLIRDAQDLADAILQYGAPEDVAGRARALSSGLLEAYAVPLAPRRAPTPGRGAGLYASHCASCHGATGAGDGPAAAHLDPAPVDFTDESRARERSVFALYQIITQGLDGTAMASYAPMPEDDRWALAFYVGQFAYPEDVADTAAGTATPEAVSLEYLVQATPAALAAEVGEARAKAIIARGRRSPPGPPDPDTDNQFALARTRLAETVSAYARGDHAAAKTAALSAYLDGIEPVEPLIAARRPDLLPRVEQALMALRVGVDQRSSVDEVTVLSAQAGSVIAEAAEALSTRSNEGDWSGFLGALTILVREGLEALLIVIAMIAFLRKADRPDVLRYVHAGWIGALAAGGATWAAATYAISISGAQRELVEGFSALLAAIVLVSVGLWLHQRSYAGRWQQYLKSKLSDALTRQSAWVLFGLSFIAVYREVFETILFYTAMWNEQGDNGPMIAGLLLGVLVLVGITIATLRFSKRLAIGQFFSWSSILMAVLALVLTGKGVAALQEAGWIAVSPLSAPRVAWLGIYPTWQTLSAQVSTLAVLLVGYWMNARTAVVSSTGEGK